MEFVNALGALTGNMAVQQVRAGLKAIYLSGWQVAGDANLRPHLPRPEPVPGQLGAAGRPTHQQRCCAPTRSPRSRVTPRSTTGWFRSSPTARAGFGGALNVYELQKAMIAAGVGGSHWEDQLASEKKCGHLGGKVLIPTQQHIHWTSARLAADVADVPTVIARTDAEAATLITSDVDERDQPFVTGERTSEGLLPRPTAPAPVIARAKACAPYVDMIWMEPAFGPGAGPQVRRGRQVGVPRPAAGLQLLAVVQLGNNTSTTPPREVPKELGAMGFRVQFITLAASTPELLDVRSGLRPCPQPDERLRRVAGAGVRRRGARLHRHQTPARGRCRLLRQDRHHRGSALVDHSSGGLDRRGQFH